MWRFLHNPAPRFIQMEHSTAIPNRDACENHGNIDTGGNKNFAFGRGSANNPKGEKDIESLIG